jgi:excisionase family DNA binding protein
MQSQKVKTDSPELQTLVTTDELAQRLRCHTETIRRALRSGRLRGLKIGRRWRIPLGEIEKISQKGRL